MELIAAGLPGIVRPLRRLVAGRALDFGIIPVLFCLCLVIILALFFVLLWPCF